MNNAISENTKVILLLTSFFNNNDLRLCKPLTINGYGYFARWLHYHNYQPADLLRQEILTKVLELWLLPDLHIAVKQKVAFSKLDQTIRDITATRIQTLLNRGASLSMAIDKWTSAGIWMLDRSNPYYPAKIKKKLKDQSPAILFGIGNVELLSKPAIGFVGSRDCKEIDVSATRQYVNTINQNGFQVVSGAAKGVDSHSMLASLQNGHASIGVIADNLYKATVDKQWISYLKSEQLVLITPFYPESKFSPANAMQRNKFIYVLSEATLVIRSTESSTSKKSGTWEGAKENLQKGWVPLMVSEHTSPNYPANQALINGDIKKTKIQPQKISPSLSADGFLLLLYRGNQEQAAQRAEYKKLQEQLSDGGLFGSEVPISTNTVTSDFPQRPERAVSSGYANKDEIDVDALASLDKPKVLLTTENIEDQKAVSDEAFISKGLANENESNNKNIIAKLSATHSEKPILSPIMMTFYKQIAMLIEATPSKVISYPELENAFPDFTIMGKQALSRWIQYLIDQGYLLKPLRKKVYRLVN